MDRRMWFDLVKDWVIAFAVAATVWLVWALLQPEPVREGEAPPLALLTTEGKTWNIGHQSSAAYVVNFWATWCGPCRKEIPELAAFAKAHPEVQVIGVSVDDKLTTERLEAEARRLGITYAVLHDAEGEAASSWGVTVYPTTFVVDRNLNIVNTRIGEVDRSRLEDMLPGNLQGSAPAAVLPWGAR